MAAFGFTAPLTEAFLASGSRAAILGRMASRLGKPVTESGLLAEIKRNKVTAALLAFELGEAGKFILDMFFGDEEIQPLIRSLLSDRYDKYDPEAPLGDLNRYREEFDLIREALAVLPGGYRTISIIQSLARLDPNVVALYKAIKEV